MKFPLIFSILLFLSPLSFGEEQEEELFTGPQPGTKDRLLAVFKHRCFHRTEDRPNLPLRVNTGFPIEIGACLKFFPLKQRESADKKREKGIQCNPHGLDSLRLSRQ